LQVANWNQPDDTNPPAQDTTRHEPKQSSRWAHWMPWVLIACWAAFDAAAFSYWWWAVAPMGFDALPGLSILFSIVVAQGGWLTAWCILKEGSPILRFATLIVGWLAIGILVGSHVSAERIDLLGEACRFAAMCGLPFLLARRQGFRLTAHGPSSPRANRSQSQFSLFDLQLLITGFAVVLATAGLPSIGHYSPVERLVWTALWAAPVWIVIPGVLGPRIPLTIILWPIIALFCPTLGAVAGGSNGGAAFWLALVIGAEGLSLLLTTSILRGCGYRIRHV